EHNPRDYRTVIYAPFPPDQSPDLTRPDIGIDPDEGRVHAVRVIQDRARIIKGASRAALDPDIARPEFQIETKGGPRDWMPLTLKDQAGAPKPGMAEPAAEPTRRKAPQVWKQGRGRPTFARMYLGDSNGLELVSLQVTTTIEGPRARTLV